MKVTCPYVWVNGEILNKEEVKIDVYDHAFNYGTNAFEGIRFYDTANWPKIFRLEKHIDRLIYSAGVLHMKIEHLKNEILKGCFDMVLKSWQDSWYLRPNVYLWEWGLWLNPIKNKVNTIIGIAESSKYLSGNPHVKIVSKDRLDPESTDMNAKIAWYYVNSVVSCAEAKVWGYEEWLLLDKEWNIAEGPGENIFFIGKDGKIYTPQLWTILPWITRATIIELFRYKYGIDVIEEAISPVRLWEFKEAFFVGTSVEVTPIASITNRAGEKFEFSSCDQGSQSNAMKKIYLDVVTGKDSDYLHYLS